MKKHARLSPSASHRWLACPGSVLVNSNKGFEQSFYALEGTTAHALLEVCLRTGSEPSEYFGVVLGKGLMEVDEGMVDNVGYALDYVQSYLAEHPTAKLLIEHTVYMSEELGIEADNEDDEFCFGTSDIILDNFPEEVVGIDYKHGIGITVSVKNNSQIRLYLLGMRNERGRYRRYRAVVIQPRTPRRKPVQEAPAITDAQLTQWADKVVRPVIQIALSKNAPRVAGEHCRYCAADGNCDAQYEAVMRAAREEFKA